MKCVIASILVAFMVVQLVAMKPGEAAVTCGQVDASLAACIPYLTAGGTPAPACCDGVKNIKAITPTAADRQAACNCVKEAAGRYPNIKEDAAASLPTKCGVQMNIPISKNTNCQNIN
ncbi:non-specific lipid-transfer protein A-like [Carica papaya]|uniref:non-specific lipid-transfer protein A-like n=1 Tax=Carica papaya TaxID=3649 RepID=UPI000B8CB7B7|nr:non-specific lipid-transfer protein A-like [Carica papaya]